MTRSEAISYCMTYALIADLNLSTSIQVYNRLQNVLSVYEKDNSMAMEFPPHSPPKIC